MTQQKSTKSNAIIAIVLVILVAVGIFYYVQNMTSDQDIIPINGEEPTEGTEPTDGDNGDQEQQQEILADLDTTYLCDEDAALGYVSCNPTENGDYSITVINEADRDQVEYPLIGVQYVFFSEDNNAIGMRKERVGIMPENQTTLTAPFSDYPGATDFLIHPIVEVDGTEKLCVNQRLLVNPRQACQ